MKDAYYFPHDYNAQDDPKMVRLRIAHGWEGYGLFWGIAEKLYNESGRLKSDYEVLAHSLDRAKPELVKAIVTKFDLFYLTSGGKEFGSKSVDRRLQERREKSAKARESALVRYRPGSSALPEESISTGNHADAMRSQTERTASALLERKGKEKKGKEITAADAADRPAEEWTETELLTMRFPYGEHLKGVVIQNMSAEDCQFLLDTDKRMSLKLAMALRLRLKQKRDEMSGPQRARFKAP